jgi:hypothetical protein
MEVSPNKKKKGRSVEWAGGEDFQPKRPSEGADGWAELNEVSPGAGLPFFFFLFYLQLEVFNPNSNSYFDFFPNLNKIQILI